MATHSSVLTWKVPWTEEPGGLIKSRQEIGMKLEGWNVRFFHISEDKFSISNKMICLTYSSKN